ncbi:MAG TPA: ORF6N domain-containing protein [Bryobacteraceae bacterium]|nr:ORF6N domain-containing protein [Bryobacteraceae bacterium]
MGTLIPVESIAQKIYLLRGCKVMLDKDLAELYQVPTKRFNEAVRRNPDRFPDDFMFQLNREELENSRSQIATSNVGHGGRRYLPYAFTEHGVAMLSSVGFEQAGEYSDHQGVCPPAGVFGDAPGPGSEDRRGRADGAGARRAHSADLRLHPEADRTGSCASKRIGFAAE